MICRGSSSSFRHLIIMTMFYRKEYLRKKRNDDYKKELEGYELWIREGEKISESEAMKEKRRLGNL